MKIQKRLAGFLAAVMVFATVELPIVASDAVDIGTSKVARLANPLSSMDLRGTTDGAELLGSTDGREVCPVQATQAVGLGVAYRTQEEIEAFLEQSGGKLEDVVTYETTPVTSAPYKAGALSEDTLSSAIAMLNQVRYVAGLSYDVTLNETYNEKCQAGALVNYVNGVLSHYPTQPSDMDDELYNLGYEGTSRSNISWASWKTRPLNETLVHGWMADYDVSNLPTLGHRRWVLNPSMKQTGFGAVKGDKGIYSTMYALDGIESSDITGVAWPAQNMPVDYFNIIYPWSVSMGESIDASTIQVTLTRMKDNKKWEFSSQSADGYFNVNNDGYGQEGCIIFCPNAEDNFAYEDGDVYHVDITKSGEAYVSYDVHFFQLDQTYQITYHLDGGVNHADNPANYRSSSETIVLQDPTKDGYLFKGWFTDSKFENQITQIETGSSGNLDLYAKWIACNNDTPYISETSITMNTKRTDGKTLSVYAAYGNGIVDITTDSKEFTVVPVKDETTAEIRAVSIKPNKELSDGNYSVTLQYKTENTSDTISYSQELEIKVLNQMPKLTVKQSAKFNYFYKNEIQTFAVSVADSEVEAMTLTGNADFVGQYNGDGSLTFALKNAQTLSGKPLNKATLKVQLKNYREPIEKAVTIAITKSAPKIVASRNSTVFSELAVMDAAAPISFVDKTRGESIVRRDVSLTDGGYIVLADDMSMTPQLTDGRWMGKKKTAKVVFLIQKETWSEAVKVSHSLKTVGTPAVQLSKKSVTVNGTYKTKEKVAFGLSSHSIFEGWTIDWKAEPVGNAEKSAFLKVVCCDDNLLEIAFDETRSNEIKAGTYRYKVSAVLSKGQEQFEVKPAVLSVKVNTKKELKVNVSSKGKIDTLCRDTGMVYTVKNITNVGYDTAKLQDSIKDVSIVNGTGADTVADKFTASLRINEDSGKVEVVVTPKADAALKTNITYRFQLKFKVEGLGEVYTKTLSIKPKQSAVKIKVSGETKLYKNYYNGTGTVTLEVDKPTGVTVDKISIQQSSVPAGMVIDESKIVIDGGTVSVPYQLTEDAPDLLMAGKTYKVKCQVTPAGMAVNKNPQTVIIKFTVKK